MPTTSRPSKKRLLTALAAVVTLCLMGAALGASPVFASSHGAADGQMSMEDGAHSTAQQGDMPEGMEHDAAPGDGQPMDHDATQGAMEGMEHDAAQGAMEDMDHDHEGMVQEAEEQGVKVGVTEHLGEYVPLDATFVDSEGNRVTLDDVIDAPTLIMPVYYTCPNVCHILQSAMARVLPEVALTPGEEIKIVSLSFDENDSAQGAARIKRNFAAALRGNFPPEHWTFLAGDKENIDRTMDAIGFGFERMGKDFAHPVLVVAVAPDGKIVRYLYGSDFLPFDVTMAATEAAKGTPGISVKRILSFCYSYDPQGRRYTFDILRVSGFAVLGMLALIFIILFLSGKKKRR